MMTFRTFAAAAAAVASFAAAPALADNKNVALGDIAASETKIAQISHQQRGSFVDTISYAISNSGTGAGVYTNQLLAGLRVGSNPRQNISNATFSLVNQSTGETLFDSVALTSGVTFAIPYTVGQYLATVAGNANGTGRGTFGAYQFSFAAAPPVPEPAVVGSMAAGLAMAGFMATRRRRKAVKTV